MSKKALLSLVLVGVMALGLGIGSYAWFTSEATSTDNIFKTGTLEISDLDSGELVEGVLNVENIYPTWTGHKTITITNSGSLDFKFGLKNIELQSSNDDNGILFSGDNGLEISFDNENWYKVNNITNLMLGQITVEEETKDITVYYRLPKEANDDYQGKEATLQFNFYATQTNNDEIWSD